MHTRNAFVRGVFYPQTCEEIKHFMAHFNASMKETPPDVTPRALIVPHAGYIYSGYTANLAYVCASKASYERIIVIGPSHRVYLEGASLGAFERYETPCGELDMDVHLCGTLKERFSFLTHLPEAHAEHSTETQMPFIQHYFPHTKVVEIVYGKVDVQALCELIDTLLEMEKTLVVISTDLSHFYTQEEANALDALCIEAITSLNVEGFGGCEACGMTGVQAMVMSAKKHDFKAHLLDYRTSFERSRDASRVVGYTSFIFA
jgi:AmmeMemoRadiSam system protein B